MRFSLKSLLAWTGVIAVYCGVLFALPTGMSVSALILAATLVMPATVVTGIVYGRGQWRAFFIGCAAASSWIVIVTVSVVIQILLTGGETMRMLGAFAGANDSEVVGVQRAFIVLHAATLISGLMAVGVYRLCLRGVSAPATTNAQPSPALVLFEPRDKAELYAILQGRMPSASPAETNGSHL